MMIAGIVQKHMDTPFVGVSSFEFFEQVQCAFCVYFQGFHMLELESFEIKSCVDIHPLAA